MRIQIERCGVSHWHTDGAGISYGRGGPSPVCDQKAPVASAPRQGHKRTQNQSYDAFHHWLIGGTM